MTYISTGKEIAVIHIKNYEDIITARQAIRGIIRDIGFNTVDQTKIVTAVSELARNIIVHAEKGIVVANHSTEKKGVTIEFIDDGPGIADQTLATKQGFSTSGSLGLGLPGAQRLSDNFKLQSAAGKGTKVTISKYLR